MKILFSVGELERDVNATTKIVLQLAEKLCLMGHSCAVTGVCNAFPEDETKNGVLIKRQPAVWPVVKASETFERFMHSSGLSRNEARGRFIKKHPFASIAMFFRYRNEYYKNVEQPRYLKKVKQLVKDFAPDAVVCVCKPVMPTETVMLSDIGCPVFMYQVDPWGMHRIDNADGREDIIARELAVFEKARKVITTPVLKEQYAQHSGYRRYINKIETVEFPNIKEYIPSADAVSAVDFDSSYTNILFGGIVTDQFRSPEYALKVFAQLIDSGEKLRVYFMGVNNSAVLDRYIEKHPENIFFVEKVSAETAFATMEKADVLFNISNMLDNQVPSKIFDYFSMGKPILNLQKIENCPAQSYFDRYPLCHTLKEFEECDTQALADFIKTAKGKSVAFEKVKEIYAEATLEYVAEVMEKAFEDGLK